MVRIITDTTSCLRPDFASTHHIPVIPQVVNFGNDSYLEGIGMDAQTFLKRLKTSAELPKTAAPPIELFIKEFERLVPLGEPILCIYNMPPAIVTHTGPGVLGVGFFLPQSA